MHKCQKAVLDGRMIRVERARVNRTLYVSRERGRIDEAVNPPFFQRISGDHIVLRCEERCLRRWLLQYLTFSWWMFRGFLRILLLECPKDIITPQYSSFVSHTPYFVFVYHFFSILILLECLLSCCGVETDDRRLKRFWSHLDRSRRSLFLDHGRGAVKKFVKAVSRDSFFAMMLLTHIRYPFSPKCCPACLEILHFKNFNFNIPFIPLSSLCPPHVSIQRSILPMLVPIIDASLHRYPRIQHIFEVR